MSMLSPELSPNRIPAPEPLCKLETDVKLFAQYTKLKHALA